MKEEKSGGWDVICGTALRCFLVIFGGTYLLWWLVLDGPAKWDKKFNQEIKGKKLPVFLEDPLNKLKK